MPIREYRINRKIVCIDSDGCAMDTMNYKHIECFGPIAVTVFDVKQEKEFLKVWNDVNLFTKTRGINRFKGLYITFEIMSQKYDDINKLNEVKKWCENSSELSNNALIKEIEKTNSEELKKALEWSIKVNEKIVSLEGKDFPFEGAKDAMKRIKKNADIAIVSSANKEAILSEWTRHGLIDYVDIVMGQDSGSKKDCIAKLIEDGYSRENVIMLGDSPGDIDAAKQNNVKFYPIMFGDEKKSWNEFENIYFEKFLNSKYDDSDKICEYNALLEREEKCQN